MSRKSLLRHTLLTGAGIVTEFGNGGEKMSGRHHNRNGACLTAFGSGMLLALLCPTRFILIIVAVAFVLFGTTCLKS